MFQGISQNQGIAYVKKKNLKIIKLSHRLVRLSSFVHFVTKRHIHILVKHLQGQGFHHFPGQPIPIYPRSLSEETLSHSLSKAPLTFTSHPPTCHLGNRPTASLLQPPFRQLQREMRSPLSLLRLVEIEQCITTDYSAFFQCLLNFQLYITLV